MQRVIRRKFVPIAVLKDLYTVKIIARLLDRSVPRVYKMIAEDSLLVEFDGAIGRDTFRATGLYYPSQVEGEPVGHLTLR